MAVIGVGIDLIDIARAERMLARFQDRVLDRLLTPGERDYVRSISARPAQHFAVRVAAKEAVYKALQALPGARGIGWRDIEVTRDDEARPAIRLHGKAAEIARANGGLRIHLSLSHSDTEGAAVAVVERAAP